MSEQPTTNPEAECQPNSVPVVPADWAALGAKSGYDPKPAEALRLFVVGPSNEGKTTFISSIPDNLILDAELGADAIVGPRSTRVAVRNYADLVKYRDKLVEDAKKNRRVFNRVSTDTIDELVAIIKQQIEEEKGCEELTEFGSQGFGYAAILKRFWNFVRDFEKHGYTWTVAGHLTTKQETNPATKKEETRIRDSVYPSVAAKIRNQCDFKLTIYCIQKTIEKKAKKKLPSGQTIEVPAGTETIKNYYADCLTGLRGTNKKRGVTSMEDKFTLPLIGGWDVFKQKYEAAVEIERQRG